MYVYTSKGSKFIDDDFLKVEVKPPKKIKNSDAGKETARMWREISFLFSSGKKKKVKKSSSRKTSNYGQRCTIKMYYGNTLEKHREFLRRYMPQENREEVVEKPVLFNERYDSVPNTELDRYEQQMDDFHFKFIVSPENQTIPAIHMVRSFVCHLEKATGFKFEWMAVEHTNTDHKHCHLLINGLDRVTREKIRFRDVVVKQTAREIACNVCTTMIGYRTKEEVAASRERIPYAYRWTRIDEQLIETSCLMFPSPVDVDGDEYEAKKIARNETEKKRLDHLTEMGLAKKFDGHIPPVYFLERAWKKKLKAIGRYNSFLDARKSLLLVNRSRLEQYTSDTGPVVGIVTQRYVMDDEGVWKNAIIVENKNEDKAWFVPLYYQPDKKLEGATVRLSVAKTKKGVLVPSVEVLNESKSIVKS